VPLKNKAITVSLLSEIDGIEDLNQAGSARGVE